MSQRKSETARLNGSKSHGPKTPEGKAKSALNALRHGLTANFHTLPQESDQEFQAFLDAYIDRYQPADIVELDLVQTMATTRWRLRRIAVMETDLFDNELAVSQDQIADEFEEIDDGGRLAWVFKKLAGESKALALLMRYEASLNRLYERTAKQLAELQSNVPRNEPTGPITSDSPSTSEQEPTADFNPCEAPASPDVTNDSPTDPSRLKPV
jgi:hypothetical protein